MRILTAAAIIVKWEKLGFYYTFFHKFLFDGFSIRTDWGLVKRGGKVLDFYFYSFWGAGHGMTEVGFCAALRLAQGTPSAGSGSGRVWDDRVLFCGGIIFSFLPTGTEPWRDFSKGSIQMHGRDWRGGRKPVPAGVRSATRGMEPKGGTPESA